MAVVYFDSSAFVKLVLNEPGSEIAAGVWDGCDEAVSSRLSYPEVRAALAAAERSRLLTGDSARDAVRLWDGLWSETTPVELTGAVEREAGELAYAHALRGADAVHLASAVVLGDDSVVVAAWDRRLRDGAIGIGLAVVPI